jgi:hypothetical protein
MGLFSSGALRWPSYNWVQDLILDHPSQGALWIPVCIQLIPETDLFLLLLLLLVLLLLLLLLLMLLMMLLLLLLLLLLVCYHY